LTFPPSAAADSGFEVFGAPLRNFLFGGGKIAAIILVAAAVLVFSRRAIPRAINRLTDASRGDERTALRANTVSGILIATVSVVVWIFASLMVLGQLRINIGPLLAGAGVAGLAIGFGAQQLVKDVIAGFFILVEDQFGVGDTITAGGVSGTVETVSLRITRIRGDDGVLHHVRNGDMAVVSNSTRGWATLTVDVPLSPNADVPAAQEALVAAMESLATSGRFDGELLSPPSVLGLAELRPDALIVRITAKTVPAAKPPVLRAILAASRDALADRGIPLAPKPPATG
jgi:small-conductance mechanosensitive channel